MGRRGNKVAFVTGPARGRGRAHALRPARQQADTIAADQWLAEVGNRDSAPVR
jgi:NAD(P)-dependent dehydrogenase (short-subunit alcohol dehydrogenase family)